MPSPLIDMPQALDAAIAASRQARRERLLRAVRNQRIRTRVAFALTACMAPFALTAFFVAHDPAAAETIAVMTCVNFAITYSAGRTGQKKAVDALRELDRSA
jgi:hypothetical protein